MKINHLLVYFLISSNWSCQTDSLKTTQLSGNHQVDSIIKHISGKVDTTIIVWDDSGNPLSFRQYILTIFNNEGMIYRNREVLKLQRFSKTAIDSLKKDDDAIARWARWAAIRNDDVLTSEEKLRDLIATLSTADRILVVKSKRLMYLLKEDKVIFQFKIHLGRNPLGDKRMEGDFRTPEGIYYVDNKMHRKDKYYKSFWISYPDSADRAEARKKNVKPGVGVMIHGTQPERVNAKDWTNGCIALSNNDIDTLFKYVISGTVIDIRK